MPLNQLEVLSTGNKSSSFELDFLKISSLLLNLYGLTDCSFQPSTKARVTISHLYFPAAPKTTLASLGCACKNSLSKPIQKCLRHEVYALLQLQHKLFT